MRDGRRIVGLGSTRDWAEDQNAYGWWTVATIALYAGYAMVILGIILGVLAILGFRHAKRAEAARVADIDSKVLVTPSV